MMEKHIILEVIGNLQGIVAEGHNPTRHALLDKYIEEIQDKDEMDLINLVLSFQVTGVIHRHTTKFNSISADGLEEEYIAEYFQQQGEAHFQVLPFLIQKLLSFMSSPRNIGLSARQVSKSIVQYIDPYAWLAVHTVEREARTDLCHFCGTSRMHKVTKLCANCRGGIISFTEFRHKDFLMELDEKNVTWTTPPTEDHGDIDIVAGPFHIVREGLHGFSYILEPNGKNFQLPLEFKEYQR